MEAFKINDFLSLRLENNKTIIYTNGKRFRQCMYLLINKKVDELKNLFSLNSVDDMVDNLEHSLEENINEIAPEVEFWGHCSNLQVWYENNYDTRMIHSNLAFPLLKRLTEVGDILAMKIFKQEIIKRYKKGRESTRKFLDEERFYEYLTIDEQLHAILNDNDFFTFMELSEEKMKTKRNYHIRILRNLLKNL